MRHVLSLFVVGFVVLNLSALLLAQDTITFSDGAHCGLTGTATSGKGKALNKFKNRYTAPTEHDFDSSVTLADILAPGDDLDRFDNTKGTKITGFVIAVKVGGTETCNCGAAHAIDKDTHIELALSEHAPQTQRVIVEVTPRLRASMGSDWTTNSLADPQHGIKGKWIEVAGWLMFDTMHINEAENTNPDGEHNWRATCWEVHPVTSLKILPSAPADTHIVHPQVLKAFQARQASALARNPERRAQLKERNEKILAGFDKEELDEDYPK